MSLSEKEALLYLSQAAPRGQVRRWLKAEGSPNAAYARHGRNPLWTVSRLADLGIEVVTQCDAHFPERLNAIPDAPLVLYHRGSLESLRAPTVAIVGARRCTRYGFEIARSMGCTFANHALTVVSGLARGIDGAAHKGVLDGSGRAAAVLGSGLLQLYPRENTRLAEAIIASGGALITEYLPDAPPLKGHFPERNRIISGLAEAVIVVEASQRSGSLITARLALEQGRDVFAVPGPVTSQVSGGCHRLIKQGAGLVEDANDVLVEFGIDSGVVREALEPPPELQPVFEKVLSTPTSAEQIAVELGLPVADVGIALVHLELSGFVAQRPDGYIRLLL